MVWILLAIVVSVAAGIFGEQRWPDKAGTGSRRGLLLIPVFRPAADRLFNLVHVELSFGGGAGIAAGILTSICVGLLAWTLAVPVLKLSRPVAGAVIVSSILANTSYLGYPLVYTLMGGDALTDAVLFDVVVSYLTLMIGAFGVGAAFGTKAGEGFRERLKAFSSRTRCWSPRSSACWRPNPSPGHRGGDFPDPRGAALVVGFFAVGRSSPKRSGTGDEGATRPHRPPGAVIFCRLIAAPSLLLLFTLPVSGVPSSYYLLAVMPTGLNSMIVGHAYGLDLRTLRRGHRLLDHHRPGRRRRLHADCLIRLYRPRSGKIGPWFTTLRWRCGRI